MNRHSSHLRASLAILVNMRCHRAAPSQSADGRRQAGERELTGRNRGRRGLESPFGWEEQVQGYVRGVRIL